MTGRRWQKCEAKCFANFEQIACQGWGKDHCPLGNWPSSSSTTCLQSSKSPPRPPRSLPTSSRPYQTRDLQNQQDLVQHWRERVPHSLKATTQRGRQSQSGGQRVPFRCAALSECRFCSRAARWLPLIFTGTRRLSRRSSSSQRSAASDTPLSIPFKLLKCFQPEFFTSIIISISLMDSNWWNS